MFKKLLDTNGKDGAALIAGVALGIVIFPHLMQKLLGLFGGDCFSATVDYFTSIGIPALIAALIILGESFGSLFLVFELISRVSAAGIALMMMGAVFLVHLTNGFFMNWFGTQMGEGFEYYILALGLAVIVILRGGGRWSLDEIITGKKVKARDSAGCVSW